MSRKEFEELGKELERWPAQWVPAVDRPGQWNGNWSATGRDGERDAVESDVDSDYPNDFAKLVADLVNTAPDMLGHIDALESVIRETIPYLERAGRMVMAAKLRKLVDG